jgi:HD-GYP domain-containing protein (c-di-GMP phosphodiesterase class II)
VSEDGPQVRRAELVALLSLGTDLGLGQPMEHMIRACLIGLRLAESTALDDAERGVVYYSGLLAWVGCHTDAYEQAKWLGDDLAVKQDAHYVYDFGKPGPAAAFMLKHLGGAGLPLLQRARTGARFLGDGRRALAELAENHYLATDQLAERLGLGERVRTSLRQSYERWDGKGAYGMRGAEITMSSRLINLADVVEVYRRTGGVDAAVAVARARSGTQFDPDLVDLFCEQAPLIFGDLDAAASWELVIDSEPSLAAVLGGAELDDALAAIGEFAELKSPWLLGHSRGVAELAVEAARISGLPNADVSSLRRAASVHDIGRLGVSNAIWDKPAELTPSELERVRLHPYLTERMLSFSASLAPLGAIAGQHHERLDGSGYPRGLAGEAISSAGRILAAADAYHAMTEIRAYRPPLSAADAAAQLRAEVTSGRLDGDAADGVLRAAGHRVRRRREWPAGLTAREVEIVRLLAQGLTVKGIAGRLVISPKTASSHVQHIYAKAGVANRAQLSLFAMRHGLMINPDQQA